MIPTGKVMTDTQHSEELYIFKCMGSVFFSSGPNVVTFGILWTTPQMSLTHPSPKRSLTPDVWSGLNNWIKLSLKSFKALYFKKTASTLFSDMKIIMPDILPSLQGHQLICAEKEDGKKTHSGFSEQCPRPWQ